MKWLKSLGIAAFAGGIIAAGSIAPSMGMDGLQAGEWNLLLARFVTGAIGGMAGLFVNKPRDPDRRERASDQE